MKRREVLAGLVLAGAGTMIRNVALPAQTLPGRRAIDVHHHVFPPEFVTATAGRFVNPEIVSRWSVQRALDEMDAVGVATAVVSITQPGVWFGNRDQGRTLTRACNEYMARLTADHRGRFGFFAALPLPDPEGSLREVAFAFDTLKADGVSLMTSYGDKYLGDPLFAPVFEELNRRGAVVHVHPNAPQCCVGLMPDVTPNLLEYPHDSSRAIANLLLSGTLSRLRDLRLIFSHAGGTMPMLVGRIAQLATAKDKAKIPTGIEAEFRRLYFDTANAAYKANLMALLELVPLSQLIFGSDFPFVGIRANIESLVGAGLNAAQVRAIESGNATALLRRA